MEPMLIGCALVLAGFAADNFAAHRWHAQTRPEPVDALAVLAFALPAAGLAVMAALSA